MTLYRALYGEHGLWVRPAAMFNEMVEIDGITVNGVDMMTWNEAGQIVDFKVMIRPLKAIQLIHQAMGAMLQSKVP